ncbi:hypothetical protein PRIC1_014761 [Phytophthora ramorum]
MRLYHCTLLAVAVALFSASDAAAVASEVFQAKRADSDTALSALSRANGYDSGPTLRSLRGKDKTHKDDVATNDDSVEDPATSEERIVVPSSIKGFQTKCRHLYSSLLSRAESIPCSWLSVCASKAQEPPRETIDSTSGSRNGFGRDKLPNKT